MTLYICKIKKKDYFMGAIADRSFNIYGTGENQIDIAKQMRLSGYINPKDQIVGSIITQLPSIFMSLTQKITENYEDYNSELTDGELSELGKKIQGQITEILGTHNCESIQDLYAIAETKQQEIAEQEQICNEQKNIFDENSKKEQTLEPQVKNLTTELNSLSKEYTNLSNSLANITDPNEIDQIVKTLDQMGIEIENKEKELETKKKELKEATDKAAEAKTQQTEANTKIESLKGDLETIKTDIATVESLSKRLKELEKQDGKDAIANMSNNDTKDISGLIKDLNEARQTGDLEKKQKAEEKLKKALEKYTKDHKEGDNKTIDLLLKKYNITWPTGSTEK